MILYLFELAAFAVVKACHTPGHQAQAQGRVSQFAWPLMDDSTNGVMIPMSGFNVATKKQIHNN